MTAASISFYASAVLAVLAALAAVLARRSEQSLAGGAIAFAALLVPLIQLGAATVAAVMLLAVTVIVVVLGLLARVDAGAAEVDRRQELHAVDPDSDRARLRLRALRHPRVARARGPARRLLAYWVPAGLGLLGFAWVVLATGSRQVVQLGEPLPPGSRFADGGALLISLGNEFVVPALLIAALALAAVIAAVLGLVGSRS